MRLFRILTLKGTQGVLPEPLRLGRARLRDDDAGDLDLHRDEGLPRLADQRKPRLRGLPHAASSGSTSSSSSRCSPCACFAEEERCGTLETLLTAPVRTSQVVLSQYPAALTFYPFLWIPACVQFKLFDWVTGPAARLHAGRPARHLPDPLADGRRCSSPSAASPRPSPPARSSPASSPSACW